MSKTSVSDVQKVQTFSGKHAHAPPTLLCTKRQFYPTKMAGGAGDISIKLGYREGIYQPRPEGFSLKEKPWGRGWVFILAEIRIQIVNSSCSFTRKEFGLYYFEEPSHFWN